MTTDTRQEKDAKIQSMLIELRDLGYKFIDLGATTSLATLKERFMQYGPIIPNIVDSPVTALLLAKLIDVQRMHGNEFFVTYPRITLSTGLTKDQIVRHLEILKEKEFISWTSEGVKNKNHYTINHENITKASMNWILTHPHEVNELKHEYHLISKTQYLKNKKSIKQWLDNPTTKEIQWLENPTTQWLENPTTQQTSYINTSICSSNEEQGAAKATRRKLIDKINFVFKHWQVVMNHPRTELTSDRERFIAKGFKAGFSEQDLCLAIDGCFASPYYRGGNPDGKIIDEVSAIFNHGAERIDMFIKTAKGENIVSKPEQASAEQAKKGKDLDAAIMRKKHEAPSESEVRRLSAAEARRKAAEQKALGHDGGGQ